MAVDLYTPTSLKKGVVDKIEKPYQFLIQEIFREGETHKSDIIRIDNIYGEHIPAPHTNRGRKGAFINRETHKADYIIPAHIRLKDRFDHFDLVQVDVGSSYLDVDNLSQKLEEKVIKQLSRMKTSIWQRIEAMCAAMICLGTYSYDSGGVEYEIDYSQAGGVVLTTNGYWDAGSANILGDIDTFIAYHRGDIDTILLPSDAWGFMQVEANFLSALSNRNINGNYLSPLASRFYVGTVKGVDLFWYPGTTIDSAGSSTDLLTAKYIYGFSRKSNDFRIEFGRCSEINYGEAAAVPFFSKIYNQEDPAGRFAIMESNPVPLCNNIDKISRMQIDA